MDLQKVDGGMTLIFWLLQVKESTGRNQKAGVDGGMSRLYLDLFQLIHRQETLTHFQVALVELTMTQKDALNVLLTGRSEVQFSDLIKTIVESRDLSFDLVCLKPLAGPSNQRFKSTMEFKQAFLSELVYTYHDATEIRVYEDRPKHVKGFRDFFVSLNKSLPTSMSNPNSRKPITAEVIHVAEGVTALDPVVETAEVQRMVNTHNSTIPRGRGGHFIHNRPSTSRLQLKRTVNYTGYLVSPASTTKLLSLVSIPPGSSNTHIKYLANSVLISPRPCDKFISEKVGGLGHKVSWQVSGIAVYESKIWVARVTPVPPDAKFYTENPEPIIILALRKGARSTDATRIQNWQPVPEEKAFVFESAVREKVFLRIENEDRSENTREGLFPSKNNKRHLAQEYEDRAEGLTYQTHTAPEPHRNQYGNYRPTQSGQYSQYQGRGGRGGSGGGGGQRGGGSGGGGNSGSGGGNRGSGGGYRGGYSLRGAGGRDGSSRGGRGRGGGGGGGGGGGTGGYGYRSLDDVGTDSRSFPSAQHFYDGPPAPGPGNSSSTGYQPQQGNYAAGGGGGGGLPYNGY